MGFELSDEVCKKRLIVGGRQVVLTVGTAFGVSRDTRELEIEVYTVENGLVFVKDRHAGTNYGTGAGNHEIVEVH